MPLPAPVTTATFEVEVISVACVNKLVASNQERRRGLRPASLLLLLLADFGARTSGSEVFRARRLPAALADSPAGASRLPAARGNSLSLPPRAASASPS